MGRGSKWRLRERVAGEGNRGREEAESSSVYLSNTMRDSRYEIPPPQALYNDFTPRSIHVTSLQLVGALCSAYLIPIPSSFLFSLSIPSSNPLFPISLSSLHRSNNFPNTAITSGSSSPLTGHPNFKCLVSSSHCPSWSKCRYLNRSSGRLP